MNTQESAVPSVFFTAPFAEHDRGLERSLTRAVSEVGAILRYPGDSFGTVGAFLDDIRNSSVVVCDVSSRNPNVMLELGFAEALKKPLILLSKTSQDAPFDITNRRYLIYGSFESEETLKLVLIQLLESALAENTAPAERPRTKRGPRIFVSYAHQDKAFLDRLMIHLRPLQKQGLIDVWVDTRISPGEKWKEEISKALNTSSVALLLVSADFLASDFIVDDELPPLLKAAKERGTVILPLILKPCRFARDPHLKEFQAINDPRHSLMTLPEDQQEALYDLTAEAVEKAIPSS